MAAPGAGVRALNVRSQNIAAQHKRLYTHLHTMFEVHCAPNIGLFVSSTSSIGGFSPGQQCLGLFSWALPRQSFGQRNV
jgi:hypothetical protein